MNLETLMIVSVVVAAVGALSAKSFRRSSATHLFTVRGTRAQLVLAGGSIWVSAIAVGLLGLAVVSLIMPSTVAIALFFGIEAVALDICAHRIRYERTDSNHPERARVPIIHR